ncbi:hypothetical protein ACFL67_04075 [candidate division KSB1 bacterium]
MKLSTTLKILLIVSLTAFFAGCSGTPEAPASADELITRSYEIHGGAKLTDWNSLSIEGRIWMNDGTWYLGKYLVFAEKPGKLRVEEDMTFAKGRMFHEYFMNDGVAWSRRNLMPGRNSAEQMMGRWNQLGGIAYYKENASSFFMKEDSEVEWQEGTFVTGEQPEYTVIETIPAYVVGAVMEADTIDLYFDKKNLNFIQEVRRDTSAD